jgi:hypothetical protein
VSENRWTRVSAEYLKGGRRSVTRLSPAPPRQSPTDREDGRQRLVDVEHPRPDVLHAEAFEPGGVLLEVVLGGVVVLEEIDAPAVPPLVLGPDLPA